MGIKTVLVYFQFQVGSSSLGHHRRAWDVTESQKQVFQGPEHTTLQFLVHKTANKNRQLKLGCKYKFKFVYFVSDDGEIINAQFVDTDVNFTDGLGCVSVKQYST